VDFSDRPQPPPPPPEPQTPSQPLPIDLKELEKTTARNLEGVAMLLHGALRGVKIARLQAQAAGKPTRVPPLDTHFPIALRNRAAMVAHLLVEYASKNEAVMRLVRAFNGLFEGGEAASTLAALAIAALASLSAPVPELMAQLTIPDVLQEVSTENEAIVKELGRLEAVRQAATAQANGARAA
jgi:hypothetical protein